MILLQLEKHEMEFIIPALKNTSVRAEAGHYAANVIEKLSEFYNLPELTEHEIDRIQQLYQRIIKERPTKKKKKKGKILSLKKITSAIKQANGAKIEKENIET